MSAKKQKVEMQNVVSLVTKELTAEEKSKVLQWAEKSLVVIENKGLSKVEKVKQLNKLETPKAVMIFFQALLRFLKNKAWTNQSWARRLGLIGATLGTAVFGTQAAGLATMGTGIGISLALVSTVGATFIGVLVDELSKEIKK